MLILWGTPPFFKLVAPFPLSFLDILVTVISKSLFAHPNVCIICICFFLSFFFLKIFIYLFLERGGGREKEKERNISVWLPLTHPS